MDIMGLSPEEFAQLFSNVAQVTARREETAQAASSANEITQSELEKKYQKDIEKKEKKKKKGSTASKIGSILGTVAGTVAAPFTGGTSLAIPIALGAAGGFAGGTAGGLIGGGAENYDPLSMSIMPIISGAASGLSSGQTMGFGPAVDAAGATPMMNALTNPASGLEAAIAPVGTNSVLAPAAAVTPAITPSVATTLAPAVAPDVAGVAGNMMAPKQEQAQQQAQSSPLLTQQGPPQMYAPGATPQSMALNNSITPRQMASVPGSERATFREAAGAAGIDTPGRLQTFVRGTLPDMLQTYIMSNPENFGPAANALATFGSGTPLVGNGLNPIAGPNATPGDKLTALARSDGTANLFSSIMPTVTSALHDTTPTYLSVDRPVGLRGEAAARVEEKFRAADRDAADQAYRESQIRQSDASTRLAQRRLSMEESMLPLQRAEAQANLTKAGLDIANYESPAAARSATLQGNKELEGVRAENNKTLEQMRQDAETKRQETSIAAQKDISSGEIAARLAAARISASGTPSYDVVSWRTPDGKQGTSIFDQRAGRWNAAPPEGAVKISGYSGADHLSADEALVNQSIRSAASAYRTALSNSDFASAEAIMGSIPDNLRDKFYSLVANPEENKAAEDSKTVVVTIGDDGRLR